MIRTLARDDGTMAAAVFGRRALASETRYDSSPVHRVDVVDLVPNAMAEDVSLALVTGIWCVAPTAWTHVSMG
ncbi:hypothetical protein CGMCC3_g14554 [Colletotrichum fructicola]|nr:uncharacterized protein CGMCC3_g14554 [Colletotrichum fructicola]KAE9569313.1 hypothetical protein CGMCC3_g14554 [Colletotrichum fructicola]